MEVIENLSGIRSACAAARREGKRIGFVPTMGALHEGHLSLVRAARNQSDFVVASIFVNPTQFGPNEDFAKYPRTFDRDRQLLESEGVEILFAPATAVMYPPGAATFVTVEGLSDRLCGKSRPGHFRGVTTIVSKLFNIVRPDVAFFGQKDAAQVAIIRKMVRDLDLPVEIVACPIVRESDGLAMSSRNAYLTPSERQQALVLHRALQRLQALFEAGEHDPSKLRDAALQAFLEEKNVVLDYAEIVDPNSLEPITNFSRGALVAVAAKVGTTRLIDNIVLPAISSDSAIL